MCEQSQQDWRRNITVSVRRDYSATAATPRQTRSHFQLHLWTRTTGNPASLSQNCQIGCRSKFVSKCRLTARHSFWLKGYWIESSCRRSWHSLAICTVGRDHCDNECVPVLNVLFTQLLSTIQSSISSWSETSWEGKGYVGCSPLRQDKAMWFTDYTFYTSVLLRSSLYRALSQ